ncbi:MAG: hypothetical protein A2268_00250 [Candidatus Raymondbacteria bacterium RifOxyA12_full_50_37]|nr:MAG: hypothetical protein A2268_00250 [Candidatus Raymondbacteria bacterium RifOxyA12_full_50_37]OGJ92749.1 MAG: hypothetical protein A2248_04300 [Candidatus Raymondbacteria bacterium RIFOXYA2_FULL_49_16]OGK04172.1 MAG: hypothetical protein A2350_02605 [Candidatus Raymondbacteria bacterium RifOxyB12_full_50_8]OGP44525.1 MAG: hypothetical protein A2324_10095 [Candidatus Raymondbacteria bacterium RIFOXYB2_FULL_49_35]
MRTLLTLVVLFAVNAFAQERLSGKLIIFHAGSLSVPFRQISGDFGKLNPGLDILLEAAGSRDCARKITDLKRSCDVMASADYAVIDQLLIPDHADWNIKFATNEMAIVYHKASRRSAELTRNNWIDIMLDPAVVFGRANPNADPCGYRAVLTLKLAEKHYARPGVAEAVLNKDTRFIRPKETDLLALLESNTIDYIFLYRSVAEQHGLQRLLLPDSVNLKSPELTDLYRSVSVDLAGKKPGETIRQTGEPMVYGVTVPKNAPNPKAAVAFVRYLLTADKGMAQIEKLGQPSAVPSVCDGWARLPDGLKAFAKPKH